MKSVPTLMRLMPAFALLLLASQAEAQSFRVQCPNTTTLHPQGSGIKCQQVAGGDGYATMADGTTTYLFGFGPASGLADIFKGLPGTQVNTDFNQLSPTADGAPSSLVGMPDANWTYGGSTPYPNGAIGLTLDNGLDPWASGATYLAGATVRTDTGVYVSTSAGVAGPTTPNWTSGNNTDGGVSWTYQGTLLATGHIDPRALMDVGVMNANQPAPLIAIDEDDELFLTLSNVGMIMRPDLFEQHTIHFHGYPNASAFYDGVPDASIAINVGGSFSYYYLAPDAGTYFWHCHIAPPEHLQMGMVGQLYVRPRQNAVPVGKSLYAALTHWETDPTPDAIAQARNVTASDWPQFEVLRKRCGTDILCSSPSPAVAVGQDVTRHGKDATHPNGNARYNFAYNDGDGSTYYDVEYPIQIHGFDPNFHFVGMTFNPESFNDMKDKYFLLNGRSYPDTVGGHTCTDTDLLPACVGQPVGAVVAGPMETQSSDGTYHASQPLPTVINIPQGGRALLRISDLSVSEYATLASLGAPMTVIGYNARLLRDLAGNNMAYQTNSITLAGGESLDVILDATNLTAGQKFYIYTPNLDHLSNDAENFGGLMTEVNICGSVDPSTKLCTGN